MEFTFTTVIMDFMWASIFLVIAKQLREKITLFQNYFIPSSLIAGFLGWILGPNMLKYATMSSSISQYSSAFIVLIFAAIGLPGLGIKKGEGKGRMKELAGYCVYRQMAWAWQFSIPIVISVLFLSKLYPGLHNSFGFTIPSAFIGGAGTAVAMGDIVGELGWADFTPIGITAAAIGILVGLIGGIIIIKMAAKRGYTSYIQDVSKLDPALRTGIIPENQREAIGQETLSPITLDSIAWHLSLILIPSGLAYMVTKAIKANFGLAIPDISVAFLLGLLFSFIIKGTSMKNTVDNRMISKISSCLTDYLVFFSLVAIKSEIVVKYAVPFITLLVICVAWAVFYFWTVAPRIIGKDWVERGLFHFGYSTGVFATGFTLLRIVDPQNQSSTLGDTAILTPYEHIIEMMAKTFGPILLCGTIMNVWTYLGVVIAYGILWLIIGFMWKVWKRNPYKVSKTNPAYDPVEAAKA